MIRLNFSLGSSASEQCAELNISESKTNTEKKRKKHKNLTEVMMESEKGEAHLESVVMKRKKMTGRRYKSKFKRKCTKEVVPAKITEELALSQSEKLLNYQGTEEQVHSVYSKKGGVKRIYLQSTSKAIDSGRDHLLAEEDVNQAPSNVDEGRSLSSSLKVKNVKMKIEKDSAKEGNYEAQTPSQQKVAVKDKDAGSEIDNLISEIKRRCNKRMNKLIEKQSWQIQEVQEIWKKKRSKLENAHKEESAKTRSRYGEVPAAMDKLKLLDGEFAKKMEENNRQEYRQLKNLTAKHLAARNEEKRKAAHWLTKAKACCPDELRDVCGTRSLGLQSEEVGGCSQSSAHILDAKDAVPMTGQHVEENNPSKNVLRDDIAQSEKSVIAPAKEVCCNVPSGNSSNLVGTVLQNEVEVAFSETPMLDVNEQLDQPKNFGTGEIICVNLPASRESVPGEMQPVKLKDVLPEVPETVPSEIVDYANPVELSNNTTTEEFDKEDAMHDALVNQRDGTDDTTTVGLALAGQILEPSEQTKGSSDDCASLLPQVPEDQIHEVLVSAGTQGQGARVVGKQNASPFEVDTSELTDTVAILQSNIELQDQDVPAIESQSTPQIEAAITEIIDSVTPEESSVKLHDQVPEEQIHQGLVSAATQDQGAQVVERQNAIPFEVAASGHVDTVTVLQSNIELQDQDVRAIESQSTPLIEVASLEIIDTATPQVSSLNLQDEYAIAVEDQVSFQTEIANSELDGTVNPMKSNVDAPPVENCEELHLLSVDVSPRHKKSPSIGVETNSSQTAVIEETEVLLHETASQSEENLVLGSSCLDIGSEIRVARERSFQLCATSYQAEPPHQAALQQGISVGSSYPFSHPNYQVASLNYPPLSAAPLQNELERIRRETEQLQKSHEDRMSGLKSDLEKEIQETTAQIHNKYELKLEDAEADFTSKKNRIEKNLKKVLMNKLLAEALRSSCSGFWHSGLPGMQQGIPSSSTQHLHQRLLQSLVRSPPVATACQPAPSQQIPSPNVQVMQQLPRQHSTRLHPITCQNFSASPVQAAQHAAALSFGTPSRPPLIHTISPTVKLHFGGEIRSLAPHLQPLRPGAASSTPATTFQSIPIHPPQLLSVQPLQTPSPVMPPAAAAPQQPSTSQIRPQHQGEPPARPYPSLSALELLVDVGDQAP